MRSSPERFRNPWLADESPGREVGQKAAAHIVEIRNTSLGGELGKICRLRRCDEALLLEIGPMNRQNCRYTLIQRTSVIIEVGPVGGAHFVQSSPTLGHDIRDSKRAADLDQLAARDSDLASFGQRIQGQDQRASCVVHY